ncbi:acetyltransferase (GNAT) family protein [Rathayibacter sp. PhB93]|uniref:GNAT family N-acetyltransferase n=1 Tax=unclassified Rathayibacter TaxID=2609250 RepID=UPI000F47C288|nr:MULTISPECIES: GNAT family N-acetyltransferase [unclassified Rathayibacter]ROQ03462.1 acetyltransferase (GNAT) family protein [Rathayibacter sp. PhB93]TDQ10486.1 acetyltransferase (GNAT) family protein [Rathayibacter sp. PhB1]
MEPRLLDRLAADAWPPLERVALGGWQLRAAGGVTKRANSVLTSGPVDDVDQAITAAEEFAREQGIAPLFQLGPATLPADLPERLARRGYAGHERTLVLTGSVTEALAALGPAAPEAAEPVETTEAPGEEWLSLWWAVDGRGGDAERGIAERILAGCDSAYALLRDGSGPAACGRLSWATAEDGERWCGLFALATRPAARRRGHAATLLRALLEQASARGVDRLWIQVLADNAAARRLYASLGCRESTHYEYWCR